MSPPVPREQWCGQLIKKHDGTGRTTVCALTAGHVHPRHRDEEYLNMRRRTDTPERRQKYRSHNHRLPSTWYAEQFEKQDGRCAICHKTPEENGKALAVDHDHACCPDRLASCGSCARGLLCNDCNLMLGRAHDDTSILAAAIAYLSQRT